MGAVYEMFELFVVSVLSGAIGATIGALAGFYIGKYVRLMRIEIKDGKKQVGENNSIGNTQESYDVANDGNSFS